jgi:hypothetical protein
VAASLGYITRHYTSTNVILRPPTPTTSDRHEERIFRKSSPTARRLTPRHFTFTSARLLLLLSREFSSPRCGRLGGVRLFRGKNFSFSSMSTAKKIVGKTFAFHFPFFAEKPTLEKGKRRVGVRALCVQQGELLTSSRTRISSPDCAPAIGFDFLLLRRTTSPP